jgi:cobalt-zinc-cadmium efflux system protein
MSHDHRHPTSNLNRALVIGIALNMLFVVIEAGYGVFSESMALIADAGHNFSDVLSLLLALGARILADKAATEKRTYGFRKATVMASLGSALLLFAALGGISIEAIGRFTDPPPVKGSTVIVVAAIGVVVNTLTALLFIKGQKEDLNIKGAFLHMVADAAVSLGVVVAGIFILLKGWLWIDPLISLVIVAVVFVGTWQLLKDSINYAVDAVPAGIDMAALKQYILQHDSVEGIHDLHVWPLSTTEIALTVHIVVNDTRLNNDFLHILQQHFHDHFGIEHSTIQIESSTVDADCLLNGH